MSWSPTTAAPVFYPDSRPRAFDRSLPRCLVLPGQPSTRHWTTNQITIDDLAGLTLEQALPLLIERFHHSPADIYEALLADYKKLTGQTYRPTPSNTPTPPDTDLHPERDDGLARLLPHLPTLLDHQGRPIRGAQTRIAELLNYPTTGGSYHSKIQEYLAALQIEFKRKAA